MSQANVAVALYDTGAEAHAVVQALQRLGFDSMKLSLVGKVENAPGPLSGQASFALPDVASMLAVGSLAAWIIAVLENVPILDREARSGSPCAPWGSRGTASRSARQL